MNFSFRRSVRTMRVCLAFALLAAVPAPGFTEEATDIIYAPGSGAGDIYAEPALVIPYDVLARVGRQAPVSAKVLYKEKKVFKDVKDASVEFAIEGTSVGTALTDGNGVARSAYVPQDYGSYLLSARLTETDLYRAATAYALFTVLPSSQPILLVDFDSALIRGLPGRFQFAGVESVRPVPFAAEALNDLSKDYFIVYMTDWDPNLLPKIRRWIRHWKVPKAPLLLWDGGRKVLKDGNWKTGALERFTKDWSSVRVGVGGTSDVMRAFRGNNVKSFAVRTGYLQEPGAEKDWRPVKKAIDRLKR